MTVWQIIREPDNEGTIIKNGVPYFNLDISWLPSTIRVVQGQGDTSAFVEYTNTEMGLVNDITSESWWSNVSVTWDAGEAAERAAGIGLEGGE